MSVTVTPVARPDQPFAVRTIERPCEACAGDWCQPGWCVDGIEVERVSEAPSCNFANMNARALFTAVGLDAGPYLTGELPPAEVRSVLMLLEVALATSPEGLVARAGMLRAAEDHGNLLIAASTDEDARRRLAALRDVLAWAVARELGVRWY